jgi:hypothetical protein
MWSTSNSNDGEIPVLVSTSAMDGPPTDGTTSNDTPISISLNMRNASSMLASWMRGLILYAVLLLALLAITLAVGQAKAGTTLVDGNLAVDVDTILRDGTWEVTGSVLVSNCTLTLDNASLVLNSTSPYKNRVVVGEAARLVARWSTIRGGVTGVCVEVSGDVLLENTTVRNTDVEYLGCGIFQEAGTLVLDNCTLQVGSDLVYSSSNLSVRTCLFKGYDGNAISWDYQEDSATKVLLVEGSTFSNGKVRGTGVRLYGSYSMEPGWDAVVRRCTFENQTYCVFANGFEEHGALLVEDNHAQGSENGLVLFWVGSSTTVRRNTWYLPTGSTQATGVQVQLRGEDLPAIRDETVVGGRNGMVVSGQEQDLVLWNVTVRDTIGVGLTCSLVNLEVHDSTFGTLGFDVRLVGSTWIHLYNCTTDHSGVVQGTGEILELEEVDFTSVEWQDGTPIDEGTVVIETEGGYQLAERNNAAPSPLDIPVWIVREQFNLLVDQVRGVHTQGKVDFYSEPFTARGVGSMVLVIYDWHAPILDIVTPTEGAFLNRSDLEVEGVVSEAGAGMGSVRVRLSGGDWELAQLSANGTWRITLQGLADGGYSFSVNATDRVGNSVQLEVENVTVDTVVPGIRVLAPPGYVRTAPVELVVVTEPGSTARVNYRPVEVGEGGEFSTLVGLLEGPNRVLIQVEDPAGNANETVLFVHLDTLAPVLLLSSPTEGGWTRGEPAWVNGTTEEGAIVSVNGQQVQADGGAFSVPLSLDEGEASVVVTAVDLAGNTAMVTRTFRVDRTPPSLEVQEPADGCITNLPTLLVVGNATDASSVVVTVQGIPVRGAGPGRGHE